MKNIHELLAAISLTVPEDKRAEFDKEMTANYKTVAEHERVKTQLDSVQAQLKTARDGLAAFDGVDVAGLKKQIDTLKGELSAQADAHKQELAEHDFSARLDSAILARHGRSSKAIRAMLDTDTLKSSKNQAADITAALDTLEKENAWLFEAAAAPPAYASGTGTAPGAGAPSASLRAAMGLPAETKP